MDYTGYTFGGRLRPKKEERTDWGSLVDLANEKQAFVYQRLSTHEQVRKHIYSVQAQDDLAELAKRDGYADEQIYVERRDLGVSGTKGQEEREGLAYLIAQIEAGAVESVYVVHISRLFRDQTLINAFSFAELCKQYGVIIVTPHMRLNLNDRMHMRIYRMEAERAADELEIMRSRLRGGVRLKARQGYYAGGSIPTGYVLDVRKQIMVDGKLVDNPGYDKYMIYEPHAEVVRLLFRLARVPGATVPRILKRCRDKGIALAPFPEELARVSANLVGFSTSRQNPDGSWPLQIPRVRHILKNPAYMGWWIYDGDLLKTDNHPPIVSEEDFWAAQRLFDDRPHRPKNHHPPLALSGLLYCGDHDVPRRMIYTHGIPSVNSPSNYQCRNELIENHFVMKAEHLDGPIGEAVLSQCAYPELAEQVLERLAQEYEEVKDRTASFRREHARLTREIENLEHNFTSVRLTPERAARIEAQIQERVARIKELSNLHNTEMGRLAGPLITPDDVELVKRFLSNLRDGWEEQPSDLKNAFLRLVLERVVIWRSPPLIRARLIWRTGLEQELLIRVPFFEPQVRWTEEEAAIVEKHYETMPKEQLMELLPERTWAQIRRRANRVGLKRKVVDKRAVARRYAPWEDELLRRHCRGEFTMVELLSKLDNRTEDSVRCEAKKLGLRRDDKAGAQWEWIDQTNPMTGECPVESVGHRHL